MKNDELFPMQVPGHHLRCGDDRRQVGRLRLGEWCRDADHGRIDAVEDRLVCHGHQPALPHLGRHGRRRHVGDVAQPSAEAVHFLAVDIEANRHQPGLRQRDGERQPNIAQADDSDRCLLGFNLSSKRSMGHLCFSGEAVQRV